MLLIDLDRFKPVNDLYGHAAGNAVLCAVADRLRAILPRHGMAARMGGDEFSMLLRLEGGSESLLRLAERVIASLSAPVLWNGNELKVGATVGIAFVTGEPIGEVQQKTAETVLTCFVPTTPNPTSGYIVMVPRSEVLWLDMTVEEAMRLIISLGVVTPEHAAARPSSPEVASAGD